MNEHLNQTIDQIFRADEEPPKRVSQRDLTTEGQWRLYEMRRAAFGAMPTFSESEEL
jgi:hypothetical protein